MPAIAHIFGFAIAVTAIGAWYDWRTGKIPNWLTLGALPVAIVVNAAYALGSGTPREALTAGAVSVLGAVACAIVPLMLYRLDAIGGGDVKLLAALGAILGPMFGIEAELYSFVAVGLIVPARLAYEGKLTAVLRNTLSIVINPFLPKTKRRKIPVEMLTSVRFGPGILAGTCGAAAMHWSSL
jgi:prepilin peptidase CpaA